MRWHHRLYVVLRGWFGSSTREREFDDELRHHFEKQVQANLDAGMTPSQARRSASLLIGNLDPIREASRDARAGAWIRQMGRDLAYGTRLLRKAPAFSISAIVIVALGLGSVTAIFSVVYGVVLRPLPFPEPERLVQIWGRSPRYARDGVSAADRRDWQAGTSAFEGIALYNGYANFNLTDGTGEPERLLAARVSTNSFAVLHVAPALGRTFTDGEDEPGRERVAILGDALWRRRFGADPAIVGRSIRLSGVPHEVIGVMGPGVSYPERPYDLWVPLTVNPKELTREVPPFGLRSIARLQPGISLAEAQSQMDVVAARLSAHYPMNKDVGTEVVGLQASLVGDVRLGLYVLLAAVGALLFVAALNLAGLVSARAAARSREVAVRLAMGASRPRVILQAVAEIVPILSIGGAIGVAAAIAAVRQFVTLAPATWPRVESIDVDGVVLLVAAMVLTSAGLVASVLPAIQAWGTDLAAASKEGGRGSSGGHRQARVRRSLVVAQVALSLPLVIAAALLARSFVSAARIDPGFRADNVVSMHLAIPRSKYPSDEHIARLEGQILERVQSVPGVQSAAFVNRLPLFGVAQNVFVEFEDHPSESLLYGRRVIAADYFRTLGIPVIEGRTFDAGDELTAPVVAVIDERVASQRWPGQSPIGKRLRFPARGGGDSPSPWMQIVGVVGHVKHDGLDVDSVGQIYWDYRQATQDRAVIVARTNLDPAATMAAMMTRVHEIDPEQPVYDARALTDVISRSMGPRRLPMALVAIFASMSLFLCCIGLYGTIAFGVTRQRREFGIRLALGASRGGIAAAVVSHGVKMAAAGIVIGLVLAIALTRSMTSMLFGVSAGDVISYGSAVVAILAVALLASYFPARGAAAVDPAITLRAE